MVHEFPIDASGYKPLTFKTDDKLSEKDMAQLQKNIRIARDAIVFFTAYAGAKGLGGHTGGAYDIIPEMLIADGFRRGNQKIHSSFFDAAGHRVAAHYILSALNNHISFEDLLLYREPHKHLPGHPELGKTPGVDFSSGRLGHMWSDVNGIAFANPKKQIIMFDSDGSMQEGRSLEAAKIAAEHNLDIKIVIDDNNVTIVDHPKKYLSKFSIRKVLEALGIRVIVCGDYKKEEETRKLYGNIQKSLATKGPVAILNKRPMAPGILDIEGTTKAHDVINLDAAVKYLKSKGHVKAVQMLCDAKKPTTEHKFLGSANDKCKPRDHFGKVVCNILEKIDPVEVKKKVLVVDSDLEGSCGLHHIRKKFGEVSDGGIYVLGGIAESNNFSLAAGFGSEKGKQGIFATFSAFQEMVISEITMARFNKRNALIHFSHSGVDEIADNSTHFGINNFFANGGIAQDDTTRLYMPADNAQMEGILKKVFHEPGLRFIYSPRSTVPSILDEKGKPFYQNYEFVPGKDEVIRDGTAGFVVSYGEMLYRALHAVSVLRKKGIDVGLINKPTLNIVDEDMIKKIGNSPFVLVVETQNYNTGLGSRFGTWLNERDMPAKYRHMGVTKHGCGGTQEQIIHQEIEPESIIKKINELA